MRITCGQRWAAELVRYADLNQMPSRSSYRLTLRRSYQRVVALIVSVIVIGGVLSVQRVFVASGWSDRVFSALLVGVLGYTCIRLLRGPRIIEVWSNGIMSFYDWLGQHRDIHMNEVVSVKRRGSWLTVQTREGDIRALNGFDSLDRLIQEVEQHDPSLVNEP